MTEFIFVRGYSQAPLPMYGLPSRNECVPPYTQGIEEHMDIHRLEQEVVDSGSDGKGRPTANSVKWESSGCRAFGLAEMAIWW